MVLPGARVRVQSWYPLAGWTRRDDGTIAFDFSADMEENPQKELLVVAPGDQLKTVGADGKVALSFSHAWTHIVINVKRRQALLSLSAVPVSITRAVSGSETGAGSIPLPDYGWQRRTLMRMPPLPERSGAIATRPCR